MDYKEAILLVDDEDTTRAAFADLMAEHGYRCITAANAIDALQIIEANLFKLDMLVTDIRMPGALNGLDLANRMRELQPDVAILLITAYAEAPIMEEVKARGYHLLEKPFRLAQLEAAIAEQVAEKRAIGDNTDQPAASVTPIDWARQNKR